MKIQNHYEIIKDDYSDVYHFFIIYINENIFKLNLCRYVVVNK